ncbi:hypothetical protein A9Q84_15995 [Halobacteriovorax marinus]|uniref:Response regulatory domain-containing protein n=1 Tax=Halobacteriovorax marinus TaxID=97084 RepID=A0A1Y5F434_9BACT|nr:hypothetical protein A9Q84_15995 [Halobacteriovorax marinus]
MFDYKFVLSIGSPEFLKKIHLEFSQEVEYKFLATHLFSRATSMLKNQSFNVIIIEHKQDSIDALQVYNHVRDYFNNVPICIVSKTDKVAHFSSLAELDCNLEIYEDEQENEIENKLLNFVHSAKNRELDLSKLLVHSRVLVVDDAKINRAFLRDFLNNHFNKKGITIDEAEDGVQCISKIKKHSYDFILLDYILPRIEGDDILRVIRKKYNKTELPVIVVSSQENLSNVKKLIEFGVNDYVPRPIDHDVLLKKIAKCLRIKA